MDWEMVDDVEVVSEFYRRRRRFLLRVLLPRRLALSSVVVSLALLSSSMVEFWVLVMAQRFWAVGLG